LGGAAFEDQASPVIEAITFDFWNTLMFVEDPGKLYKKRVTRVERVLAAAGHNFAGETIADIAGKVWEKTMNLQYQQGLDFTPEQQVQEIISRLGVDGQAEFFDPIYVAYTEPFLDEPPQLMEGVRETLEGLAPYFRMGIICNTGATPGVILRRLLKQFQLDHYFAVMTFSNEEEIAKPNPLIFRSTLDKLGVKAGVAVHIGDDPITDVGGAGSFGMQTIWLSKINQSQIQQLPDYTWRVGSLREIPDLLIPGDSPFPKFVVK